jgi:hypothetical protein
MAQALEKSSSSTNPDAEFVATTVDILLISGNCPLGQVFDLLESVLKWTPNYNILETALSDNASISLALKLRS